jgi:hypothetical protein
MYFLKEQARARPLLTYTENSRLRIDILSTLWCVETQGTMLNYLQLQTYMESW